MPKWWKAKDFSDAIFVVVAVLSLFLLIYFASEALIDYLTKTKVISIWTK